MNKLACVCLSFQEKISSEKKGEELAQRIFEINKQLIELGEFMLPDLMASDYFRDKE